MAESGIGGGLGVGQTAPVAEVEAGQNRLSPRMGERDGREPEDEREEVSAQGEAVEDTAQPEAAGEITEESERPQHRIDSLA